MYRRLSVVTVVVIGVLMLGLLSCTRKGDDVKAPAPDFALQDLSGQAVKLSDYSGKVVLLEFWATWCPPCRASVPGIERIHKEYGPKGLVVLAVSMDQGGWDSVQLFQKEYGITYSILKGDDDVAMKYMVRSIPMAVIVDRNGMIRKRLIGFGSEEDLEGGVKALL
jgi:thiol-disulfide isomerase/thioredoxin